MSWCDKLASTPGVGFKLDYHFAPAEAILHALAPVLDPLIEDDKARFSLERLEPFTLVVTTNSGFQYVADSAKFAVTFAHRLRVKQISGGPPQMEMLSSPRPFTKLLPDVADRLIEATLLLPGIKTRTVRRIGITSTTAVAEEEMPPGIDRFIKYVGRPWKGSIDHYNIQVSSQLASTPNWSDRCIHTVVKKEDREQLLSIGLDWQRTFASGRRVARDVLKETVEEAKEAAVKYFEDVAEGSRFDEELIRSST